MKELNSLKDDILAITKSGKFGKDPIEQQLLGLYNGISAFSNEIKKNDKEEIENRYGAILVNLLSVANTLNIDVDKALSNRIKKIGECHGTCRRK